MIQLLHISDVHLNAGFANKNPFVRQRLKDALYESIREAVNFTIENKIEGLIISGDFFDHDKISFKDENFVLEQFGKVLENDQKIFYVTGNHDPMLTAEFIEPLRLNANFYFFADDEIKIFDIIGKNNTPYKVVGVGHKSKNEQRNLIKNFPVKFGTDIWVGIGHASVPSALSTSDKESYMAAALSQIEALNYDYFALGHIHIRQQLTPKIAYSGNPQGLNIKETGAKGGYLVDLTKEATKIEIINLSKIRFEQVEVQLSPDTVTFRELELSLINEVMNCIGNTNHAAKQIIVRIHLKGRTPLKYQLQDTTNIDYITESIKDKTGILDLDIKVNNISNHYDLDELSRENTVLSQMIRRISEESYEEELIAKIINLPIYDQTISKNEKLEYLARLKESLLEEVIDRMVVKTDEN